MKTGEEGEKIGERTSRFGELSAQIRLIQGAKLLSKQARNVVATKIFTIAHSKEIFFLTRQIEKCRDNKAPCSGLVFQIRVVDF